MTTEEFEAKYINQIVCGDCLDVMGPMPDGCVDMCVTSPPYWGLRDYGVDGQMGLEATPEAFIAKMVAVFAEVKRVLADHGTLWLNMGDSYTSGGRANYGTFQPDSKQASHAEIKLTPRAAQPPGLKPKDLCGIPWRLALALQADGWYLRSDIIWHKPNPMPESCRDRPTKAHEYLFLLTKKPKYYYDQEAIREGSTGQSGQAADFARQTKDHIIPRQSVPQHRIERDTTTDTGSRNKRSVWNAAMSHRDIAEAYEIWMGYCSDLFMDDPHAGGDLWTIPTQAMSAAHFATFPEKLVEPCIRAGTSDKGNCPQCGKPWERVVVKDRVATRPGDNTKQDRVRNSTRYIEQGDAPDNSLHCGNRDSGRHVSQSTTTGWRPTCGCYGRWYTYKFKDETGTWRARPYWRSGKHPPLRAPLVLDPFGGSGTVGVVAGKLKRDYVLIELNPEYAETIAQPRLDHIETGVPVAEQKAGQAGLFESPYVGAGPCPRPAQEVDGPPESQGSELP